MKFSFKILLLLIAFSFLNLSAGYTQDLEDYKKEYVRLQDSVDKYNNINDRLSIGFAKDQLSIAEKVKDTFRTIKSLHYIARASQSIGEFNESVKYFDKELELIKKYGNKKDSLQFKGYTEIEVLAQLGQNYAALGEFKRAFNTYDKCIEIAEELDLGFYKAVMPAIIAELHYTSGNYSEALAKYKESYQKLKTAEGISETTRITNRASIIISMSDVYLRLNEKDSALWALEKGKKERLDTIQLSIKMNFVSQRGKVFLKKGEYSKALSFLKEAENIAYQYDSILAPGLVSYNLSETYFKLNEYQKAIATLENGIAVANKLNIKNIYLAEDYKLLAKIYKASGDLEKSNEYYEKYILNQTALEKSRDTISSTFHRQELSNLEKEKSSQKSRFYTFISIGLALLFILLMYIAYLVKEKKKNTKRFDTLLAKFNQNEASSIEIINTKDKVLEEKVSTEVNEETIYLILAGLQNLKEQEYFLRQDCNSYNVAKKIKTNTSYLSKVINSHFEKNFNTYINDLRINYAILRLKDDSRFRSFSVQSIAEEIGYKSADSFTKYFKLRTGLNPSFYIKQLNSLS